MPGSTTETNGQANGATDLVTTWVLGGIIAAAVVAFLVCYGYHILRRASTMRRHFDALSDDLFAQALLRALNFPVTDDQIPQFRAMAHHILSAILAVFGIEEARLDDTQHMALAHLVARYLLQHQSSVRFRCDWVCSTTASRLHVFSHLMPRLIEDNRQALSAIFQQELLQTDTKPEHQLAYRFPFRGAADFVQKYYAHLWQNTADMHALITHLDRSDNSEMLVRNALWYMHERQIGRVDSFYDLMGLEADSEMTLSRLMPQILSTLSTLFPLDAQLFAMLSFTAQPMPLTILQGCYETIHHQLSPSKRCMNKRSLATLENTLRLFQHCAWVQVTDEGVCLMPEVRAAYWVTTTIRDQSATIRLDTSALLLEILTRLNLQAIRHHSTVDAQIAYCNSVQVELVQRGEQPSALYQQFATSLQLLEKQKSQAVAVTIELTTTGSDSSSPETPPDDRAVTRTASSARVSPSSQRNLQDMFAAVDATHRNPEKRKRCVM